MTAPIFTGFDGSVSFAEDTVNAVPQIIDSDVTVTDIEGNFDGGRLVVAGLLAEDTVSVRNQGSDAGQIGFSGGSVTYGGTVIGTATGGVAGSKLVITFNASATTEAVDALVQNLAYANASDTPTASRTLSISIVDASGASAVAPDFVARTGAGDPFAMDVGLHSAASFADLDSDGDLDIALGDQDGNVHYFRNTGSNAAPAFTEITGVSDPFNGINVGTLSKPTLADLDGDGDVDLIVGEADGFINYYKNTGSASAPVFTAQLSTANPFNGVDVGSISATTVGDLDGDGDLDMVVGNLDGILRYFRNTGTTSAPAFTEQTGSANPFDGVDVGSKSVPTLGDIDLDGDLDLIVGEQTASSLNTFLNTGTASAPVFVEQTGAANPFAGFVTETDAVPTLIDLDGDGRLDLAVAGSDGNTGYIHNQSFSDPVDTIDVGFSSAPAFGDLDGDGDLDMLSGEINGTLLYFENTGTGSGQGPIYVQQTGAANPLDGADVGSGSTPVLVDLDGDGDLDLVSGENDGNLNYYKNTGTASAPVFVLQSGANDPFDGIDPSSFSKPAFGDLDGDGDQDMLLGLIGGNVLYYQNVGTATAPAFVQGSLSGLADVGSYSAPALGDVDGDGDLDVVVGKSTGAIHYFENTGSTSAATFVERTGLQNPFADAPDASSLTLADIDEDGDVDLVIGTFIGTFTTIENTAEHVTVTITAENDAPVAANASFTVGEGGVLSSNVTATDVDGSIADYVVAGAPAKGSVDLGSDGYFTFDTGDDFESLGDGETEQVTFTYHAVDDGGASSVIRTVTITVTGVNDLPSVSGLGPSATFAENTVNAAPQLIDASVTVTDPEGDFDGGAVTVSGLLAEDVVSINHQGSGAGQIGFSAGTVTYAGVAVGTATGGAGADLVVMLNAAATPAAVEALIENLTYANTSDAPTASRSLTIAVADASGGVLPVLTARTGTDNPFAGIDTGDWNKATFGDLDGDGDLDMIVGDSDSGIRVHENIGTADAPAFAELTGSDNPLDGVSADGNSSPALVDIDGDGDQDLVIGSDSGTLRYLENTGSAAAPVFTARTGAQDPFDGIDVADGSAPAFGDLDGDGDLDLVVGVDTATGGTLKYFENTGTEAAPSFSERTGSDNPFDGFIVLSLVNPAPTLGDFDDDGDLDLAVGTEFLGLEYFQNTGSAADPSFVEASGAASPFYGVVTGPVGPAPGPNVGQRQTVTFVDLDDDGDLDAAVGGESGMQYAENAGTAVTINVTAENDAPVAADGSAVTDADAAVTSAVPAGADADGTVASYVLDTAVATGRLTFNADGTYIYDPDAQFNGLLPGETAEVSFTYHAVDDGGASSTPKTVTITISGVDAAPQLNGLASAITFAESAVNGGPQVIDASVVLADREGDFDGGVLTVTGLLAEDKVAINHQGSGAGQIGVSGTAVSYGGVVIGAVTGGAGVDLIITLNADASTEAVEALIQNLAYANGSDTPTASRTLSVTLTDAGGDAAQGRAYVEQTGADSPLDIVIGQIQKPVFADLDDDGDLDVVVGQLGGTFNYLKNTGSATDPFFVSQTGANNPFNGVDIGSNSAPTFGDLDGDGDLDMVSGKSDGTIAYYKNTGTALAPAFTAQTGAANPFDGIDLPNSSEPALADLDQDGDLDMVVGTGSGQIQYFRNNGTAGAPAFAQLSGAANPFDAIDVGTNATPALVDFDGDGDFDMIAGGQDGNLRFFENSGTAAAPVFVQRTGEANPLGAIPYVGANAAPALADLDGDRDLDLVVGQNDIEAMHYFEDVGTTVHQIAVTVTAQNDAPVASDDAATITEGGVLTGSVPAATDVDGTIASYVLDSDVAKGTLTLEADGTYTFDPNGAFQSLMPGEEEQVTFTWHALDDGGASSGVETVTITVTGTVPTIDDLGPAVTFSENAVNAAPAIIDADVTVTEATGNLDGGKLTVSGLLAEDTVAIRNEGTGAGEIGVSGSTVSYGGTVIGTVAGGSGVTLVVTFNASATQAAVEALIENLTYANSSSTPTASRTLSVSLGDATSGFAEQAGGANPFGGLDVGNYAAPALADIDGDGDLDLLAGGNEEGLSFFLNTGSATVPAYVQQTGAADPFGGLGFSPAQNPTPTFVDLDADGDMDLVTGSFAGNLRTFLNTGNATTPTFTEATGAANPLAGIIIGYSAPAFADLDGDGDLDIVVGDKDGTLHFYENTGTAAAAAFTARSGTDDPFDGIDVGDHAKPAFADLDGDGDLDLVAGEFDGTLHTFENIGSTTAPAFTALTGSASPFAGFDVAGTLGYSAPAFADVDGDGDLDVVVGAYEGGFATLVNDVAARSDITVNVTAENEAPVASNSSRSTDEDTVLNWQVPAASDEDGTIASYVLDDDVAKGALVFDEDGFYSFDPDGDFEALGDGETEEVTFTYHAVDDAGASSGVRTVTITVTGINDAPALSDLGNAATFAENTANASPQLIDGDVVLADPEGNFDGGTVAVSGLLAEDVVSVRDEGTGAGEIGFSGGIVTYGGVAVGAATGGAGGPFTVTFNADATSAAVEALIQNLTYANTSDSPTASRTLIIAVTDGDGASRPTAPYTDQIGAANPFAGIDLGDHAAPAFADIDGDGDLDLVVGVYGSGLHAFENTGAGFVELTGANNPFDGISIDGGYATPAFADIDGDGDLDLVVGSYGGAVHAFENTGTGYVELTGSDNPFDGINPGRFSAPAFGDFDGDGDLDLILGAIGGQVGYHENTGTTTAPVFTERSGPANPFDGVDIGNRSIPAVSDVDGDGDLDVLLGERDGDLTYLKNTGSPTAPTFGQAYDDEGPFSAFTTGGASYAAPVFADLDGDGDMDLAVGHDGQIRYIEKSPSTEVTINVTAENDLPVAANDTASTSEGSVLSDSVPAASDEDGTIESYALVSDVAKGALTFTGDGTYSFDPDGDFEALGTGDSEEVTFTWKAIDNDGGESAVKTVTITVTGVNDLPVATDSSNSTDEGTILNASVPAATDIDGTIASYALVSDVAKGALTFTGDGTYSFDPDGDFEALGTGDSEEVTFTWKAIDNDGGESTAKTVTITVTGVNDLPVASNSSDSTDEDSAVNGAVPAASDVDGTVASYAVVADVAKGDLTFNSDGTYSFAPDGDFEALGIGDSEEVTFTWKAIDNDGGESAAKTVTITVTGVEDTGGGTNDVPEITSASSFTIVENSSGVGQITASDSDGTPTFSIVGGADALLFAIDSATGVLSFRASPDFEAPADADGNNVYDIVVGASDGSDSDTATIAVTVANEAGVGISGGKKKDVVDDGNTVKGGVLPTGEEDEITGNGKNDKLSGLGGNDLIDGGKGKDKMSGGDGDDWLVGGKANDKLSGGGGADSFVFNQKLKANVDKIGDFATGVDRIVLDDKVFKALSPGTIPVDAFLAGRTAKDAGDHVLYNAKKGVLLYDADGKGGGAAVAFAKIGKGLDLDAGDFLVI